MEPKILDQLLIAKIADQHFGTEVIENKSRGQSFGPNLGHDLQAKMIKSMNGKIFLKCM